MAVLLQLLHLLPMCQALTSNMAHAEKMLRHVDFGMPSLLQLAETSQPQTSPVPMVVPTKAPDMKMTDAEKKQLATLIARYKRDAIESHWEGEVRLQMLKDELQKRKQQLVAAMSEHANDDDHAAELSSYRTRLQGYETSSLYGYEKDLNALQTYINDLSAFEAAIDEDLPTVSGFSPRRPVVTPFPNTTVPRPPALAAPSTAPAVPELAAVPEHSEHTGGGPLRHPLYDEDMTTVGIPTTSAPTTAKTSTTTTTATEAAAPKLQQREKAAALEEDGDEDDDFKARARVQVSAKQTAQQTAQHLLEQIPPASVNIIQSQPPQPPQPPQLLNRFPAPSFASQQPPAWSVPMRTTTSDDDDDWSPFDPPGRLPGNRAFMQMAGNTGEAAHGMSLNLRQQEAKTQPSQAAFSGFNPLLSF